MCILIRRKVILGYKWSMSRDSHRSCARNSGKPLITGRDVAGKNLFYHKSLR